MLNVKKAPSQYVLNKVVTNIEKGYWQYYTTIITVLIVIVVLDSLIYQYIFFQKKHKELAFIKGSEVSIKNLIVTDLKLIFNNSADLNQLSILKNYSQINKQKEAILIIGNILYIKRGQNQMIFDLQPLIFLVNSILAQNFYYQITLNDKVLITNIEDTWFTSVKKYQINKENLLIIKLKLRQDSQVIQVNLQQFNHQILVLLASSTLFFLAFIPLVIYIVRKVKKFNELNEKILVLKEEWGLNLRYTKALHDLGGYEDLPITFPIINTNVNQVNVTDFMKEIEIFVLAYNIRIFYNFELCLVSDISIIDIKLDVSIFKQIIISLIFNILYFMRGGTHTKRFSVKFQKDRIIICYDSFAANEKHMCQWSEDILEHLGNAYIVGCRKIFQLIESYGLSYEVVPQQGNNIITIFNLNKNEGVGRVIKFNKG